MNRRIRTPARIRFAPIACLLVAFQSVAGADEQAQIDFANGLFARGFNEEAADEYRSYLDEYPEGAHRPEALYRLGEAELALGRREAALEAFDRLLQAFPNHDLAPLAQSRKGVALYELERYQEAAKTLEPLSNAEAAADIRMGALYFLGKTYLDGGAHSKAVEAFRTLAEELPQGPYAPAARYQLAFAYLAQDKLEQAAVAFSELAGLESAAEELRREARFRAAEAYDQLGWYDAAVKAYRQVRDEFPGSEQAERAVLGHAWALYHAGNYAEAAVMARQLVENGPEGPHAADLQYILGNCLQQQNDNDAALAAFRKVRERYPKSEYAARALFKEGQIHYVTEHTEQARAALNAFLERDTKDALAADAQYLLGMIAYSDQRLEQAADRFRAARDAELPGSYRTQAAYQYAVTLFDLKRFDEAEPEFARFAEAHPKHPRAATALLRAGDAAFQLKNYGAAEGHYTSALSIAEADRREDLLYRLAVAQHNADKDAESAATFETLLADFAESDYAAEAHLRVGNYWLKTEHEPLKAMPHFEAAHAAAPGGPYAAEATKQLALARYEAKDLDGAASTFVRIMREWPGLELNESTYAWVGQHLFDNESWEEAVVAFRALLDNVPDYPHPDRALFKIAECKEHAGQTDAAVEAYQAAVEAVPGSATAFEARLRMGQLVEQNQPERAAELYAAAAEQSNGAVGARARFRLGALYESQENFQQAAREFMRVAILYLHPDLAPEALWRAAQCFEKHGSTDQARKTYEELVRDYPDSEQAAKAKQRLTNA